MGGVERTGIRERACSDHRGRPRHGISGLALAALAIGRGPGTGGSSRRDARFRARGRVVAPPERACGCGRCARVVRGRGGRSDRRELRHDGQGARARRTARWRPGACELAGERPDPGPGQNGTLLRGARASSFRRGLESACRKDRCVRNRAGVARGDRRVATGTGWGAVGVARFGPRGHARHPGGGRCARRGHRARRSAQADRDRGRRGLSDAGSIAPGGGLRFPSGACVRGGGTARHHGTRVTTPARHHDGGHGCCVCGRHRDAVLGAAVAPDARRGRIRSACRSQGRRGGVARRGGCCRPGVRPVDRVRRRVPALRARRRWTAPVRRTRVGMDGCGVRRSPAASDHGTRTDRRGTGGDGHRERFDLRDVVRARSSGQRDGFAARDACVVARTGRGRCGLGRPCAWDARHARRGSGARRDSLAGGGSRPASRCGGSPGSGCWLGGRAGLLCGGGVDLVAAAAVTDGGRTGADRSRGRIAGARCGTCTGACRIDRRPGRRPGRCDPRA